MKISFLQLSIILLICVAVSSANKPYKHAKKGRDVRESKDYNKRSDDDGSCCCETETFEKRQHHNEEKMSRFYYDTVNEEDDDDFKHKKNSKSKKSDKPCKNSDTDKRASKKSSKKVKDVDDEATSVFKVQAEDDCDSKIKNKNCQSNNAQNSSISSAIVCLQKCVEVLTKWKLY